IATGIAQDWMVTGVRLDEDRARRSATPTQDCILIIGRCAVANTNRIPRVGDVERILNGAVWCPRGPVPRARLILVNIEKSGLRWYRRKNADDESNDRKKTMLVTHKIKTD